MGFRRPWRRSRKFSCSCAMPAAIAPTSRFRELVEKAMGATMPRADLHLSRNRDGELVPHLAAGRHDPDARARGYGG